MPRRRLFDTPADLLEYEFAQEKASALGRLGRALEAAIATLSEFDSRTSAADKSTRDELVAQASAALWQFVVQREACGMRDVRQVLRDYRVPAEVAGRMGAWPVRARSR
jgi:hypothetical protein